MKTLFFALFAALPLASCDPPAGSKPAAQASINNAVSTPGTCRSVVFENSEFTNCLASPGLQSIKLMLGGNNKAPYRTFSAMKDALGNQAPTVAFAMNAGMFNDDGLPIGYYVENKNRLKTLNRKEGGGNFHLMPNGVFSVDSDGWHIRTTDDFADNVNKRPEFATQSGPMLLIDGKLHPKIAANGESANIRNAIGIDAEGRAHFVISEVPVSFGKIARMMRDKLGCVNALYLDGSVSGLWYPAGNRMDSGSLLGPFLVAIKTPQAKAAAKEPE
jgi:uncharacterized protein YigE (DUF2233 family)